MWPALLAAADLLVCPSRHEPLGNVVIEAWAAGVPVVATASDGPAGADRATARAGCWCRSGDAGGGSALADAIERVCRRSARCARASPRRAAAPTRRNSPRRAVVAALSRFLRPGGALMCGIAGLMTLNGDGAAGAAAAGDGAGAGASRSRRRRALPLGRCRHGADAARDHRSRDRRPAALRARRRRADRQWRDLQLPRAARANWPRRRRFVDPVGLRAAAASLSPARARLHRGICAACTRSRCTIRQPAGWCWRAIRSASSRSTTPRRARGFAFASEPRRADRGRHRRAAAGAAGAQRAAADAIHHRPRDDLRRHQPRAAGRDGRRAPRAASSSAGAARRCRDGGAAADRRRRGACRGSTRRSPTACALHQRSDVPFGMFLSGGIDSTAVLAMMARLDERPVKAFTIGFAGGESPTSAPAARAAAQAVGAEHVEVDFGEGDFWRCCPRSSRRSTIRPPITRSCRPTSSPRGARGRAQGDPVGRGRRRALRRLWPLSQRRCGRGGPAGERRGRAACSTGSAYCAAISPAGATASPRPSSRSSGHRPHAAAGRAGGRLRRLAAERSADQARSLPDGARRRGPHALSRHRAWRRSPSVCRTSSR